MSVVITHREVQVKVEFRQLMMLRRHAKECPLCLDEAHGTRGCPRFNGAVESVLLELKGRER